MDPGKGSEISLIDWTMRKNMNLVVAEFLIDRAHGCAEIGYNYFNLVRPLKDMTKG